MLHTGSKLCLQQIRARSKNPSIACSSYLSHGGDGGDDDDGLESDPSLGCALMHFHSKLQKSAEMVDAVFSAVDQSDARVWSSAISAHVKLGHRHTAIMLYMKMVQASVEPTVDILVSVLNACAASLDPHHGMAVHLHAVKYGLDCNVCVGNSLIHMYIECRKLDLADRLFATLPLRNVVTWNSLMSGQVRSGLCGDAILIFTAMNSGNVIEPNDSSFASVLKACADATSWELGLKLHGYYTEIGRRMNSYVGNNLITMYARCGHLDDARAVFDMLMDRTVVTWNAMIGGYSQHGCHHKVLKLVRKMQEEKWMLDSITIVFAIKACSCLEAIEDGEILHASIVVENAYESNVFVGNALIVLYANHARIRDALSIFHTLPKQSESTWNSIIGAFVLQGSTREALLFFERMQVDDDVHPNDATFVSVLKACCSSEVLCEGRRLHAIIVESKPNVELDVGTCLLDMYAKCGSLSDARSIFDGLPKHNLITWNAMITAYAQYGRCKEAFYLFDDLQQCSLKPSIVTYIGVLKACRHEAEAESRVKIIHAHLIETNCAADISLASILVDMYIKGGDIEDAEKLITLMPTEHATRTWNGLIFADEAADKLSQRTCENSSMVALLSTHMHRGLVEDGCSHFRYMWESLGASPLPEHYSCMGDLFGRVGHLNEAKDILQTMPLPCGVVSSTSLITHCKAHGNADLGKQCFDLLNPC